LQILPFNIDHAKRAGAFAEIIFRNYGSSEEKVHPRAIIPNDAKLFAQADLDSEVKYYITADNKSKKILGFLKTEITQDFTEIYLQTPYTETFGLLDL